LIAMTAERTDTHSKALAINLDSAIYGTFAEIGAGQEVARWFLQVGGAAGTVAKTMSAYDMKVSDAIYGGGSRYVSRERLLAMLEHEYRLLLERLDEPRGADTRFFVFADTVAARNYAGTNECHGWMGMRFQTSARSAPSDILLHVNMLDPTNLEQQKALGLLGVNLVHGCYFRRAGVEDFLAALQDELSLERIEIDVVESRGPAFEEVDGARLGVRMVTAGLARAVLFREDGTLVQPSDLLRKRPLVLERSLFARADAELEARMLEAAVRRLQDEAGSEREPLAIPELSVVPAGGREAPDEEEALRRLGRALSLRRPMLLTRYPEAYHLTHYLRRYTREPLRFVFGVATLVQIFQAAHYADLIGGVLEATGRLLAENVRLYVYPMEEATFRRLLEQAGIAAMVEEGSLEEWVTAESIRLAPPVGHLYDYLREAGWIVGLHPEK
jgi:phosphoglycolate phosphatase-like HAD superfamily hydrolase